MLAHLPRFVNILRGGNGSPFGKGIHGSENPFKSDHPGHNVCDSEYPIHKSRNSCYAVGVHPQKNATAYEDNSHAHRPLRILSIGVHPVGILDQSGGAMAHHAAWGDYVACVVLTHGARVHDKIISDAMFHREQVPTGDELLKMMAERSDVKVEEVRKACGILGFRDVYFFGEDDAVLLMREDTVKRLARYAPPTQARYRADPFPALGRRLL